MPNKFLVALALIASSFIGFNAQANKLDWRNNRVLSLEKVTVGPTDNYQGQFDSATNQVFYTQHQSLLSSLVKQNLTTGLTGFLLPADYDAKEPALAPNGQKLAFTLFRFDALGDICLLDLHAKKAQPECLTPKGSREWQAFWVNNQQLGYLHHNFSNNQIELKLHSLATNSTQVIATGQISAPSASPDGKWLVYNRGNQLYFYNLAKQQEYGPLQIDLPGMSSFARFDTQQEYIYFSHYLNDTNQDQKIDAQDHSILFRLKISDALKAKGTPLLPEQLTSVAQNCSFPFLTSTDMYLTCAFEGSLDNYRLPLTGQIPATWQAEELNLAHAQAASYEERLLILNSLRYRQLEQQNHREASMLARLLSNHLALNEFTASSYYVQQLQDLAAEQNDSALAQFYGNLNQLIHLQAQAKLQPRGVLSASFRQALNQELQRLNSSTANPKLFQAWAYFLLNQPQQARSSLSASSKSLNLHPLETYLQLSLAEQIFQAQPQALAQLYQHAILASKITSEARLYYAFQWLQLNASPEMRFSNAQRQQQAERLAKQAQDERVQTLLLNEVDLLSLSTAADQEAERPFYASFNTRLAPYRDDAQLSRLAHLRGIQITGLAEKYNSMEQISRRWLTHTNIRNPGFAQVADTYANINLSRAYGNVDQQQNLIALNSFYALTRQTSDPEAVYQIIELGLQKDPKLEPRMHLLLNQLEAEELIQKNDAFSKAAQALVSQPNLTNEQLEQLAQQLSTYKPQGINRGAANLLAGSLYQRLLIASQNGYSYNRDYYRKAHYNYMLGLDLAWDNPRTQAALLNNLGNLHLSVRNYGLANNFFAQRLQLPFIQPEDELYTRWQLARSLYYSNRFANAAEQAELALNLTKQPEIAAQLSENNLFALEKAAFYNLQAQNFAPALKQYQKLLASQKLNELNATKAKFSLAYANFKLGNKQEAATGFELVLQHLPNLSAQEFTKGQMPSFNPLRLELQSYGFLAQLSTNPADTIKWLKKRQSLLQGLEIKDLRLGFNEDGRLSRLIQTQLQLALAYEQQQQTEQLAQQMQANLNTVNDFLKAGASPLDQAVMLSLTNYFILAATYPTVFAQEPKELNNLFQKVHSEWQVEPETPTFNLYQQHKLQILLLKYRAALGQLSQNAAQVELDKLKNSPARHKIEQERPELGEELERLGVVYTQKLVSII